MPLVCVVNIERRCYTRSLTGAEIALAINSILCVCVCAFLWNFSFIKMFMPVAVHYALVGSGHIKTIDTDCISSREKPNFSKLEIILFAVLIRYLCQLLMIRST